MIRKNITNNALETEDLKFYRYYFINFLIKTSVNEDKVNELINNVFDGLKDMCEVMDIKMCGKKKLSYPIQKQLNAIYTTVVLKIQEDDNLKTKLNEINRRLKAVQEILRYLVYRYNYNHNILPDNLISMKTYIDKNILENKK